MKFLIHLLGGWTEEEYVKMRKYLVDRFQNEYQAKKQMENNLDEIRRVALDIAGRYKDIEAAQKIIRLGQHIELNSE